MRAILARAHQAAAMAGIAERTGVAPRGLSRAERADVKRAVDEQLRYLRRFAGERGGMSEAAQAARSQLYAGAIKATYGAARHPGLPFYPTQGSECLTNCKCEWKQEGDGVYLWTLHADEHCATCTSRASGNPYKVAT